MEAGEEILLEMQARRKQGGGWWVIPADQSGRSFGGGGYRGDEHPNRRSLDSSLAAGLSLGMTIPQKHPGACAPGSTFKPPLRGSYAEDRSARSCFSPFANKVHISLSDYWKLITGD